MAEQKATNITWHDGDVTRGEREQNLGQKGVTVWPELAPPLAAQPST